MPRPVLDTLAGSQEMEVGPAVAIVRHFSLNYSPNRYLAHHRLFAAGQIGACKAGGRMFGPLLKTRKKGKMVSGAACRHH